MKKNTTFRTKRWGLIRLVVVNILVITSLLIVVEGLASYLLFARDVMETSPLAERRHTKYDPDLGWVNIPNVDIQDMYGPGMSLRTNSQGFRNNHDIAESVPFENNRIICSGDSFTFGYGVDNSSTWCQQLVDLDRRLETVNMAQGGYGVDQAYLWYMRDGTKIEHNIQILAFITDDFYRMQRNHFLGYSKPVLAIENGAIVVRNTPVPQASYIFSFFTSKIDSFKELHTVELVNRVIRKISSSPDKTIQQNTSRINEEARHILLGIIEALNNLNKERQSKLILVYLPTHYELKGKYPEEWINFIENAARDRDIPFINIMDKFHSIGHEDALKLFIPGGKLKYPGAAGHLNDMGNKVVADVIYEELRKYLFIPQ